MQKKGLNGTVTRCQPSTLLESRGGKVRCDLSSKWRSSRLWARFLLVTSVAKFRVGETAVPLLKAFNLRALSFVYWTLLE